MRAPQNGYVEVGRIRGVPIRLHWTVPLGAVLPAVFVGFRPLQGFYLCIGYRMLVGIHEAGHVVAAKAFRLDVMRVDITGAGGMCWVQSPRSLRSGLWLYSGGLVAQALLLVVTAIVLAIAGRPSTLFFNCVVFMFTFFNVILLVINMIPFRTKGHPTDGLALWRVVADLRRRRA